MMTAQEIQAKADELTAMEILSVAKKAGEKVYAIAFNIEDDQVVGYLREPRRQTKMAAWDMMAKGKATEAGEVILTASLIPEYSDQRLLSLDSANDDIYLSACIECIGFVKVYGSDIKKN